ncbi:secondary metabolism regulator LAE1 [Phialemonium atrogriseum]|uniref:Secondary metabolism regulator LAE1 n=1 Tax=Phialemonium atrogriseum TaxID=1093897 RepID=A0AAJ0FM24_9PEZI|nr:secondary metabolism regulator LAE1 [Phialemonium atrogriseum]KAK1772797.1 secondary metabolism regulator LAE1 [Phialemonium atrogriseum]
MAQRIAIIAADDIGIHDDDSAIGENIASSTTSLTDSILDYRKENGRTYHRFREGKYHYPNDDRENQRLDLQHHLFLRTFDGALGLAPPAVRGAKPGRVLDLGTGTGIWAVDYGEENPEAEVIGVDLSPIQPDFVPPNVEFQIDDVEDDWTYTKPFDYIHSRMMTSSIANWPKYIERCFQALKPGGYLELQEGALYPNSDDGTLKPDSAMWKAIALLDEATTKFGRPFQPVERLTPMMEAAGFEGLVEARFAWPSNPWPRDRALKELGAWNHENMTSGLSGFFMAPLTRAEGWRTEEVEATMVGVRRDFADRGIHAYWPM